MNSIFGKRLSTTLRRACAGLAFVCAGLALATSAAAQAVYNYTGNPFTLFSCGPSVDAGGTVTGTLLCAAPGANGNTSYLATDKVTATLSLTSALPPNQTLVDVSLLPGFQLTMNDGRHTVTNAMVVGFPITLVTTDASGNITNWRLILNTGGTNNGGITTQNAASVADSGSLTCCHPAIAGDLAFIFSNSGTWTAPPPSPAAAVTNLINLVNNTELGLTVGQVASLTDALNSILASIESGQNRKAIRELKSFIRTVESAQRKGTMTDTTAATLIAAANAVIAML